MDVDSDLPPLHVNRKRAASSSPPPETEQDVQTSSLRAKHTSELDHVGLLPRDQSWDVDLESVLGDAAFEPARDNHATIHHDQLSSDDDTTAGAEPWPDSRMDGVSEAMMTNLRALSRAADPQPQPQPPHRELLVLCVLGDLDGHYWLLDALLPVLQTVTRELRCFAVATDVEARKERLFVACSQIEWAYLSGAAAVSGRRRGRGGGVDGQEDLEEEEIRFVQPVNRARTFTRLGVLHPLGGGREPLDAIVLLERDGEECKRRMVLPFGWGAGRLVMDEAGGWMVRGRLMEVLREGIEEVCREWKGG